jgi:hypothetical protein
VCYEGRLRGGGGGWERMGMEWETLWGMEWEALWRQLAWV